MRCPYVRSIAAITVFSVLGSLFSGASLAAAAEFDPSYIMTDAEIRDTGAMGLADISLFLSRHGGLGSIVDIDPIDGLQKGAAQLIYDAAQRYRINPEYILALLQKESSIVETMVPTQRQLDWAAGYALCDGCRVDAPLPLKYKGFARQVDAGAGWMDWYLTNAGTLAGLRQPGQGYDLGGTVVVPANLVTAGLYSYTPHLHGNQLLWQIMQRWFGAGGATSFPDGTLVRNKKNGAVALMQGGKFRPILKRSVLMTRFRSANIVDLPDADFSALERSQRGAPLRFADLSLVRTETGATFLLIGNTKRPIPSMETFGAIGFNPEEVETVAAADIDEYVTGEPILPETSYPLGELLQDTATGGVYYAESGMKHPLWDKVLLSANFADRKIVPAPKAALDALKNGAPVLYVDGLLVKAPGDPTVYLISGGKKRSFPTERDFTGLGFRFGNVVTVSPKLLALHETGLPISLGLPLIDPNASVLAAVPASPQTIASAAVTP